MSKITELVASITPLINLLVSVAVFIVTATKATNLFLLVSAAVWMGMNVIAIVDAYRLYKQFERQADE